MKQALLIVAVWTLFLGALFPVFTVKAQSETNYVTLEDTGIEYAENMGLGRKDPRDIVASVIRVAIGLLGIVAVVIVLIGGFTWMTAGGNDDKISEAKKWIFAGVIGLAIILSAFAISSFVLNNLVDATTK